ncbi:MAG: phosphodiester glycosidase family protein [Bacteroidia bacterium]|nr:phosphodiester glycosidase family protein [Bacteroidia bacterium]
MQRAILSVLLLFLTLTLSARSIVIDGKIYTVDTTAHYQIGPATYYTAVKFKSNDLLVVYFVKTRVDNPYIKMKVGLSRDSIYGVERPSALAKRKNTDAAQYIAGTNADFYDISTYVGYTSGGCMVDNQISKIPSTARPTLAFNQQGFPYMGLMGYKGTVSTGTSTWDIKGVNHLRGTDALILYNQHNGKSTRTNTYGTELLVQLLPGYNWGVNKAVKVKVISVEKGKGNMLIPAGHAVLSGNGTAAGNLATVTEGQELTINLNLSLDGLGLDFREIIGGDYRNQMLKNGIVEQDQIWNERHPRTAVGYSKDSKTMIMCVVDGRGVSAGVTTKQLAQIMKNAGAHNAFNFDGGGSSTMYLKNAGVVNVPSDGNERAVANSLYVVSSAPITQVISEIQALTPVIKLISGNTHTPKFNGYNEHGTLIVSDLKGLQLSCTPGIGQISNGVFTASGTGEGYINAEYNGIKTTIKVIVNSGATTDLPSSISEDFSSKDWELEFQKYNPGYFRLAPGFSYTDINSLDLYFDSYLLSGSLVGFEPSPNCVSSESTHTNGQSAIAFQLNNDGNSHIELPEIKNAETLYLHVRNSNRTTATTLTVQKWQSNAWVDIQTLAAKAYGEYSSKSLDELLICPIHSPESVKLRITGGDLKVNIFKIDLVPYGTSALEKIHEGELTIQGRMVYVSEPMLVELYNFTGTKILETKAETMFELPAELPCGIYIIKGNNRVLKTYID